MANVIAVLYICSIQNKSSEKLGQPHYHVTIEILNY